MRVWFRLGGIRADETAVELPAGIKAVWDLEKAYRESTATRERICLNGLWRWQPANKSIEQPPSNYWGFFKVPGCWPGISDYMQKDSQTVQVHPAWQEAKLGALHAAWYEREMTVPSSWKGERITLAMEYLILTRRYLWMERKRANAVFLAAKLICPRFADLAQHIG